MRTRARGIVGGKGQRARECNFSARRSLKRFELKSTTLDAEAVGVFADIATGVSQHALSVLPLLALLSLEKSIDRVGVEAKPKFLVRRLGSQKWFLAFGQHGSREQR